MFQACSWSFRPLGMGVSAPSGISATEILSACLLLRIPRGEWDDVFTGVRWMVNAALPYLQPKRDGQ